MLFIFTCFSYLFSRTSDSSGRTTSPTYSITISSAPMCSIANSPQSWMADLPNFIALRLWDSFSERYYSSHSSDKPEFELIELQQF